MAKDWKRMRGLKSSLFSYGEVREGLRWENENMSRRRRL
jgi:hypothetical protein